MYRQFLILLFSICSFSTFADAAPKFSEDLLIRIEDDKGQCPDLDSICVIIPGWHTTIATLNFDVQDYWTGHTLHKAENNYSLFTFGTIDNFIVVVFINSEKHTSKLLHKYRGNNLFVLKANAGKLTDVSPFLHCTWSSYFIALIVTLLIEVLLGLIFFYKNRNGKSLRSYLVTFSLVNLVTHFSLWLIYSNADIPLFFLELVVAGVEAIYWSVYLKVSGLKAFLISLLTNFVSWIVGALGILFI